MTSRKNGIVYLLLLFLAVGCYPKGAEYIEELDLVYTNYSSEFDFQSRGTYALPDSVVKIDDDEFWDPDEDDKPDFASSTYSTAILSAIRSQMQQYGWTEVDKNANPDVIILPTTMTTTNIYYYYDWWYWNWWYPGWGYWGWYYPGWYYPPYVTGYRSGSVFIQLVDNEGTANADNIPVVWNAILNGLAEGGTADIANRITIGVQKAFAQSPYLKIN